MSAAAAALQPRETTLVLATPEQSELVSQICYEYWIKDTGASFSHYKRAIEQGEHATEGRLQCFVLVPRNDMETLNILSFVRTMKRDCIYRPSNTASESMDKHTSYVIEAVYTPPSRRRNGYAAHALRLLHYILAIPTHLPPFPEAKWGPPPSVSVFSSGISTGDKSRFNDALFCTLWSDVGRDYYAQAKIGDGEEERDGWVVYNDQSVVITFFGLTDSFGESSPTGEDDVGWEVRADPSIIPLSQRVDRDQLKFRDHTASAKALVVECSTTPGALDYYLDRMSLVWPAKYRTNTEDMSVPLTQKVPTVMYLAPSSSESASSADASAGWAVFCPHHDDHPSPLHPSCPPTLDITDIHIPPLTHETFARVAKALLVRLAEQARIYGCEKMEVWGADEGLLGVWKGMQGVEVEPLEREMRLGALAWYGPQADGSKLDVVSRQMYTWA